jgi:hypothetical protein
MARDIAMTTNICHQSGGAGRSRAAAVTHAEGHGTNDNL